MSNLPPSGEIPRGAIRFNTDSNKPELWDGSQWAEFQLSTPNLGRSVDRQPGARGCFGGGHNPDGSKSDVIYYINLSSTGDAVDFGNLSQARSSAAACSSSTRGLFGGGISSPSPLTFADTIDFITISSTGNATDFGNLTQARDIFAACSSSTRGIFGGGRTPSSKVDVIDFVTIASTGNAVDFGNLIATIEGVSACSSSIRGVWGGGNTINTIQYVTIASTGNATDFGDLAVAREGPTACSSSTRGVFAGGDTPTKLNSIEYIQIATLGNAVKFGDLTVARSFIYACSSSTRGVFAGGYTPTFLNTIDYITILSTGDAVDFGDLTAIRLSNCSGLSNAHGGL